MRVFHSFLILVLSLYFVASAQDKELEAAEKAFYEFTEAYFAHDMEKLKALTFFNDELDLLGEMPGYTEGRACEVK